MFRARIVRPANAGLRNCFDCRHSGGESRYFSDLSDLNRRGRRGTWVGRLPRNSQCHPEWTRKEKGPRGERVAPSGPIQAGRKEMGGKRERRLYPIAFTGASGLSHAGSAAGGSNGFLMHQPPCVDAVAFVLSSIGRPVPSVAASLCGLKARAVPEGSESEGQFRWHAHKMFWSNELGVRMVIKVRRYEGANGVVRVSHRRRPRFRLQPRE